MSALTMAIAGALLKKYTDLVKSGELDKDFIPDSVEEIAKIIESLVPGFLNLGRATKVTPALIDKIEKQLKTLQGFSGGLLKVDGILGKKMLNWLSSISRCKGELEHTPTTTKVPKPEPGGVRKIRYWYATDGLPDVSGGDPEELLVDAFISWIRVIDLDVLRAKSKAGANVIVTTTTIDGQGGVLADAHIGPPDGMQRTLRFDKLENWDADKFKGTAAHEIGHLLGLGHASGPGQLMSPLFQAGILGPTAADVTAILKPKLGWKARKAKPKPKTVVPKRGKPVIDPNAAV